MSSFTKVILIDILIFGTLWIFLNLINEKVLDLGSKYSKNLSSLLDQPNLSFTEIRRSY